MTLATEGGQLDGNEGVDDVLRGSTVAKAGSTETLRGLGGRDRLYAGLSSTASLYGGRDDDQLFTNAAATKSYASPSLRVTSIMTATTTTTRIVSHRL